MSESNLMTTFLFNSQEYLIRMNVVGEFLEICVTDKQSGEEWQCSYDHSYIENLTHKTGNFKQFDIFVTMLKSGLLKTSECISLDLLSYEDLEALRVRKVRCRSATLLNKQKNNRRYLILIYNVEFDRILYPLPLEYCGPPDPAVLQATVKRLETELLRAQKELENRGDGKRNRLMEQRIDDLLNENQTLREQLGKRGCGSGGVRSRDIDILQSAVAGLEKSVAVERKNHARELERMHVENGKLAKEIGRLRLNEDILCSKLKSVASNTTKPGKQMQKGDCSVKTVYRKFTQPQIRVDLQKYVSSGSPRRTKSEGWTKTITPPKRTVFRGRDRSSSTSSKASTNRTRTIEQEPEYGTGRHTRARSRSSSASRGSSTERSTTHSSQILKMKLKTSQEEFRSLEGRIAHLQRMLRTQNT